MFEVAQELLQVLSVFVLLSTTSFRLWRSVFPSLDDHTGGESCNGAACAGRSTISSPQASAACVLCLQPACSLVQEGDEAVERVVAVEVLHLMAAAGPYAAAVSDRLDGSQVWQAYRHQKHDLFLPAGANRKVSLPLPLLFPARAGQHSFNPRLHS